MTLTLRSFHQEVQKLIKSDMDKIDAYERAEQRYFLITGKRRYKNYKSFRQMHWQIITGNYKPLK